MHVCMVFRGEKRIVRRGAGNSANAIGRTSANDGKKKARPCFDEHCDEYADGHFDVYYFDGHLCAWSRRKTGERTQR